MFSNKDIIVFLLIALSAMVIIPLVVSCFLSPESLKYGPCSLRQDLDTLGNRIDRIEKVISHKLP